MKRASAHAIGKMAANIMGRYLSPIKWSVNGLTDDDYGKDFLAEWIEDPNTGDLSGQSIYIQLKGTSKKPKHARGRKDCFSFQLKKKHAVYYVDKVDIPVFLVLSHNSAERAYYVFVQSFLEQKQGWRQKKSVAIHLPIANDLANGAAFEKAAEEANAWMRRKHPCSLKEAHDAAIERYRKLDPRFELQVSFKDGHPHFEVVKGPPLTVRISADNLENASKGKLIPIKPGVASIEGSAIFDELNSKGGAALQITAKRACDLEMTLKDSSGKTVATLRDVRGEFSGGLAEHCFRGTLRRSPFAIETGAFANGKTPSSGTFKFNREKWHGQEITMLAHFDNLYSFFKRIKDATQCVSTFIEDGNTLRQLNGAPPPAEYSQSILNQLEYLNAARQVCKKFGVAPVHSQDIYEEEFFIDVDEAYGLLFDGEWKQPFCGGNVNMKFDAKRFTDKMLEPGDFTMVQESTYTIAGQSIEIGKLHHRFTEMVFEKLTSDDPDCVSVVAKATKDSMRILWLDESSPFAPHKKPESVPASVHLPQ